MAKISTYLIDAVVQDEDKWIGTDSLTNKTRNFTAQALADNFNRTSKIGVGGQIPYRFYAGLPENRPIGTMSFPGGGGDNSAFSTVTNFVFSKFNSGEKSVEEYLSSLNGKDIFVYNLADVNKYAKYKIQSLITRPSQTTFFDAVLGFVEGSGTLEEDEYYGILAVAGGDKEFIYTQVSASSSWVITHNLSKFPSVTVVDSGNNIVIGDITYNDLNTLTINFTASFSGKAYLN